MQEHFHSKQDLGIYQRPSNSTRIQLVKPSSQRAGTKLPALELSVLGGLEPPDWPERLIFELAGAKRRLARALEQFSSWLCFMFPGLSGRCSMFSFGISLGEEGRGCRLVRCIPVPRAQKSVES